MPQKNEHVIAKNKLPNVLLMFGEEEFLLSESYEKIVSDFSSSENAEFNTDILDAESGDIDIKTIVDIASSYPFMGDHRLVVVKNFEKLFSGRKSKKDQSNSPFGKYLSSPQPSTFLILKASIDKLNGISRDLNNPKKKAKAEKTIDNAPFPINMILRNHDWIEFPKIYERELAAWVNTRIKKSGRSISPDACELLIAQGGNSLREITNEIEKLFIYISDRKNITLSDVNIVVTASRKYNVFELQKAIGNRNLQLSLKILEKMLSSDRQEMLIITMITRYFSVLWKLYELSVKHQNNYQLASQAGISPFFVPEYLASLKKYKSEDLDNAFVALKEADISLKTVSTNSLFLLQNMIIRIIQGKK